MEPTEVLRQTLQAKCEELGRWQMYKQVLELMVPVSAQLPASFISAIQRIDPRATP